MTFRARHLVVAVLFALVGPLAGQQPGPPPARPAGSPLAAELFREGLMLERAEGRLQDAIFRYERVVAEFPRDAQIAPRALYQLALAYEKTKDPRVGVLLTRLVAEYPTAEPYATEARTRIAALQGTTRDAVKRRQLDPIFESGSPDGRWVVYHKDGVRSPLYLRDLRSRAERLLLDLDGAVSNYAWSPDSRRLAFNFQRDTGTPRVSDIRIVTIATGDVASLNVRGYPMSWTANDEIFFYLVNYTKNAVDWSLVPAAGGQPRVVASPSNLDGGFALVMPDSRSVLLTSKSKLVLRDIATGAEREVTAGSSEESRPMVSPDGRLIAFLSRPDGQWGLYAAPVDRIPVRNPVRLASVDPAVASPATQPSKPWWTTDGLITLPVRAVEGNLFRIAMDPTTGRAIDGPVRLTQDAPQNSWPAISPDGKRIAYTYRNLTSGGVAVMNADGTSERPLVNLQGQLPVFWRTADEVLFYDFAAPAGQKPAITSVNLETGTRQALAHVEGLYWWYVPDRREIVSSHPGGGGARPGVPVQAHSLADGTTRTVATIDYLMPRMAMAADGRRFAYAVTTAGGAGSAPARCEVAIMSLEGVREKVLVPMQEPCGIPVAWSPDSRFLLLSVVGSGPRVVNVQTGESWALHPSLAVQSEGSPASWSPDGSFVVLVKSSANSDRVAWEGVTYEAVTRLMAARR